MLICVMIALEYFLHINVEKSIFAFCADTKLVQVGYFSYYCGPNHFNTLFHHSVEL